MGEIIKIKDFHGGYKENQVLKDLTVSFEKGSFTAIAGPNGSGKSTLLKYLIKELKPEDNSISIISDDINILSQDEIAKRISFVGQNKKTDYEFTVKELVTLGRYCHKDESSSQEIVQRSIKTVGIESLSDKLITQISGGELQLAMLARAICQESEIMLLDEPVNSLDPYHEYKLMNILKQFSKKGKTVICVLHDINLILEFCDSCILLKDGKIISQGKTEKVITVENIKKVYNINCEILNLKNDRKLLTVCSNQ